MKKKLLNKLMKSGLKAKAEKLFFLSVKTLQKKIQKNSTEFIKIAVINSSPVASVRAKQFKKRKKKVTFAPYILTKKNRLSFAINSFIEYMKNKKRKSAVEDFVEEIMQAGQNLGYSVEQKTIAHEKAFLKKKFSYFRWF